MGDRGAAGSRRMLPDGMSQRQPATGSRGVEIRRSEEAVILNGVQDVAYKTSFQILRFAQDDDSHLFSDGARNVRQVATSGHPLWRGNFGSRHAPGAPGKTVQKSSERRANGVA
jgi:hypothetical protein